MKIKYGLDRFLRHRKGKIVHEKAEDFFQNGPLPRHLTPEEWGGTASGDKDFAFFKEQLKIRAKNEKEFKL